MSWMSYQALYRVWRPQTFTDVVGQGHITKTLQNALLEGAYSHAYLFSGPRGTGKTSTAKILAKAVNCEHAPVAQPCNQCTICQGITQGSVVDVLEIDAASNNGVEQIRDIRDNVKFAPTEGKKKVYIIDEVHMLSQGAFNALLKTLEEPPAHVMFILATTEPHKIPLTIISRCQRFDFKRISRKALMERMTFICQEQHISIQPEAIQLLAQVAEGGMRDALSLLDQVVSFADNEVTLEDCLAVTGTVAQETLAQLADAIIEERVDQAIRYLDTLMNEGKEPLRLVEDLIYYYRDLLLYQSAPGLDEMFERVQLTEEFKQKASMYPREKLFAMIERLSSTQNEMKWSNHPRVFLEVAFIQLIQATKHKDLPTTGVDDHVEAKIAELTTKIASLEEQLNQVQKQSLSKDDGSKNTEQTITSSIPVMKVTPKKVKKMLLSATKTQFVELNSKWSVILEEVKKKGVRVHAWLKDSEPVACSEHYFLLAFQNEIHRDTTEKENHRTVIESVVQAQLQTSAKMMTIMYNEWSEIKEQFIREQKGDSTDTTEKKSDPFYEEAIKLVGEELVEVVEKN